VRGKGILRTSPFGVSRKFALKELSEVASGIVTVHTYLRWSTGQG
jgi:hypothetical protein